MMSVVRFAAASSPDVEEAARPDRPLQSPLATQRQLEQLLKLGRTHLQELRGRLQQTTADRDRFQAELAESRQAHQRDVERLQQQLDAARDELQRTSAERTALAASLDEQDAAAQRSAEEWADERNTFARLLNEATFNQREMAVELDAQRKQIDTLRETATRAQSLARDIIRAHEPG